MRASFVVLFLLILTVMPAVAQEASPGDVCDAGRTDHVRQVGGVETNGVVHLMRCDGANWQQYMTILADGKVGFNETNPSEALEVEGDIAARNYLIGDISPTGMFYSGGFLNFRILNLNMMNLENSGDPSIRIGATSVIDDIYIGNSDNDIYIDTQPGNVGIGTGAPDAKLDVAGEIKFSSSGLACSTAAEGSVRYTGGDPPWEFCDGSAWVNFKQPRCQDDDTGECYLDATRSNDDPEFIAANIKDGVNILGVTGTFTAPTNCPNIGDTCDDGSIYAGNTPDDDVKMYTTPADAPSTYTWNDGNTNYSTTGATSLTDGEGNTATLVTADSDDGVAGVQPHDAAIYCDGLSAHGHSDWYLPARDELNTLYNNLVVGAPDTNGDDITDDFGFNISGSFPAPAAWYWSSSEDGSSFARFQRFSDGAQLNLSKPNGIAVRCVRR